MSALLELVREDLRGFAGYASARSGSGKVAADIWLNANESAWANAADGGDVDAACRRYPDPQPAALCNALASLYGCDATELLIGRGSDEAIDLLVRALCVPGRDTVVIAPPVFGMYAVSARLQGARLVEVPLLDDGVSFAPDFDGIVRAVRARGAKLVFLCSPANPTGAAIPPGEIARLATHLGTGTLVVVDEAYGEYAGAESALSLRAAHPNIAVLRTLSKAHALAAARIGCVVADAGLIAVLRACQAPYPVPGPCAALALAALSPEALARTRKQVATTISERTRVAAGLAPLASVRAVYPSDANFLLLRFVDAGAALARLLAAGIVVRDQRGAPQLHDALRITIGTPAQNDRVLQVLGASR